MNQSTDGAYNAVFDTTSSNNGEIGLIKISSQLKWFVNWTITLYIEFVRPPSTSLITSDTTSSTISPTSMSTIPSYYRTGLSTTWLMTTSTTESSSTSGYSLIISFMPILFIFMIR
ncbi:MAG: hypothetical protein ACFFFH_04255 [Candidatus Thorarchaeota archaeon]